MIASITLALALLLSLLLDPAEGATRADQIRQAKASTVLILAINDAGRSVSLGSGFFLDRDGLLVTNAHVIEDGSRLHLYVEDQAVYSTPEVVAVDPDLDLAALRIQTGPINTLQLAEEPPSDGAEVIAIGYPRITDILQMGFALHSTIAVGTVSGMAQGRSRTQGNPASFIQTTGILNFGNSGGPLLDTSTGEVVGMVVTTVPYLERARDRSGTAVGSVTMKSGIGYSIPAAVIKTWLEKQQIQTRPSEGTPASRLVHQTAARRLGQPDAARSFATGHLLQTIAMVLHDDSDLLKLAVEHYGISLSLRPEAFWAARNLGRAHASLGDWDRAAEAYERALKHAPEDVALLTDAGLAWQKIGRADRAREAYGMALRLNPASGRTHNNFGNLLWELGRLEEAIEEFRQALKGDPTSAVAAYNLGLALEAKGLRQDAVKAWESFLVQAGARSEQDAWSAKMREGLTRLKSSTAAVSLVSEPRAAAQSTLEIAAPPTN
jgi:S1-C subfamily serine protease/Flp pilus assembly protein TadD